jgi:hypothetical protein
LSKLYTGKFCDPNKAEENEPNDAETEIDSSAQTGSEMDTSTETGGQTGAETGSDNDENAGQNGEKDASGETDKDTGKDTSENTDAGKETEIELLLQKLDARTTAEIADKKNRCSSFEDANGYYLISHNVGTTFGMSEFVKDDIKGNRYVNQYCSPSDRLSCVNPNFINYNELKNAIIMEQIKFVGESKVFNRSYVWNKDTFSENTTPVSASDGSGKIKFMVGE